MDLTLARLSEIPNLTVSRDAPLSAYTRFAIGGPADLYAETESVESFIQALAVARASGRDFMVMGGYGHSRLREFVLGGVTHSILKSMTVPVLMSH